MQNNNKRNNHKVTVDGTTLTLSQWAHLLHLNRVMFTNKFRAVVDEAEYIRRLMRKEVSIFDKLPYDLCKKRKERCDKGIKRQTKEPNMKQEEKDELVHNLHSHFGDASDPYAARAAKIIADELDKPDNKADLDRLIAARKAWTDAKIPRTKEGDKMLEDLFAKESAIIDELVNKFCPDNWKKNDLKWP